MGRKTETYNVDTRSETNYRFEQQQKNLGPQLGGVIFSEHSCCLLTCCCLLVWSLVADLLLLLLAARNGGKGMGPTVSNDAPGLHAAEHGST